MALDESDMKAIQEMISGEIAKTQKGNQSGNQSGGDDDDEVRKIKEAEAKRKTSEAALKAAMTFNIKRDEFLEKNKDFLPESITTVIKGISGHTFKDEEDEANAYRKIIFDEIFENQENIDMMPDTCKARIQAYKKMADSDKAGAINGFYELVEMYLALKKGKAQSSFNAKGTSANQDEYTKRFEALGSKK